MSIPRIDPEIDSCIAAADHVDIHSGTTTRPLRSALAAMISWQPWWLKGLYVLRTFLAPLFGIRIVGIPPTWHGSPDEIPFQPGERIFIGTVWKCAEDRWWSVEADDRHLRVVLLLLRLPGERTETDIHLVTAVFLNTWRGRLYHRVILPFHRRIVRAMLSRAA